MSDVDYTVPGLISAVDQGNGNVCWCAATTVLNRWKDDNPNVTMDDVATKLGIAFQAKYIRGEALSYNDIPAWKSAAGMESQGQQCLGAEGWQTLLKTYGPLIVVIDGTGIGKINHAVVAFGIKGDGSGSTLLSIANSNGGNIESYTLSEFAKIFEIPQGSNILFSAMYYPQNKTKKK